MNNGFRYVFWGLVFAYFNFSVGGVGLLPDVVGFGLIAIGAYKLSAVSSDFSVALWLMLLQVNSNQNMLRHSIALAFRLLREKE